MAQNTLVKHYAGSIAYGTNLPTSDVDFRGIFCADPVNIRTPFFVVRECIEAEEEDTKLYELAHFMKLCVDCNPNIIETLWVDEHDIVQQTPAYEYLRSQRQHLLSAKIAFTTCGYALSQLKRIKGHNKWINNPQPETPPRQADFITLIQSFTQEKVTPGNFQLPQNDHRLVPYGGEIFGLYSAPGYQTFNDAGQLHTNFDGERHLLGTPKMVIRWVKDEYKRAKEKHQQYWTWKENRNEARSQLEEQFGYDTKHAMHVVRLLRMGVEALRDGEIIVKRPDASELLEIRNGAWRYEALISYAENMDREVREKWYKKTELPKAPNLKLAAEVLMAVQDLVWH